MKTENIVSKEIANELITQYRDKYIKSSYKPWCSSINCKNLPWCYYEELGIKIFGLDDLPKINIPLEKAVYCHDEVDDIMYQTTFGEVLKMITNLEPWEGVDIEIFDESLDWTIAITHEEEVITYGVEIIPE